MGAFTNGADHALTPGKGGYWFTFIAGAKDGDHYKFLITGDDGPGEKRDPYARSIALEPPWPHSNCAIARPDTFPWHDAAFRTPPFRDLIVYQLHVGAFYSVDELGRDVRADRPGRFLDLLFRLEYLADLGVTAVQLLPIQEFSSTRSLGYNGTDYFSPEMDYSVRPEDPEFQEYLDKANDLLAAKGHAPFTAPDLARQTHQLMAIVDLCHVYGIAVIFDVVYNHAGGDFGTESIYFFDRQLPGDQNRSLYFTDQGWAGGLVFAFWKDEVRQFLIDNATFFLNEYHVDGFRFDEVTVIDRNGGWRFLQDLTGTLRALKPSAPLIAEYWADQRPVVRPSADGGAGFDSVLASDLRGAIRAALADATHGQFGPVDLDRVAATLRAPYAESWRAVQHLENHDVVRVNNESDREPRVPAAADPSDHRSWFARSRSRVANGLLLTAPGIPMLFMGQEMLEDKFWSDNPEHFADTLIWWDGLAADRAMSDHLRFVRELIAVRRRHDALRNDHFNAFHVHNQNRVIACHRWVDDRTADVVIVATLSETTWWAYDLGFPRGGEWLEVFNSDLYDHWVNPLAAGNGGKITAAGPPRDGFAQSATIVIPANAIVVFAATE